MVAYLIVDIDVHDADRYRPYLEAVPELVAKHGGQYLVRGGEHEVLEGTWRPNRLVLFRFPSRRAIEEFLSDPDYAPLKELRQAVTTSNLVAVDGIDPDV